MSHICCQRTDFIIRDAVASDARSLLAMMRQLAKFENYIQEFSITEADLITCGLETTSPQFDALVAEGNNKELLGYAVVYPVNFTYDLKPNIHIKEFFVCAHLRQQGVGKALMHAVIGYAKQKKAARLKWDVLPSNDAAKLFYKHFSAQPVKEWEAWTLRL